MCVEVKLGVGLRERFWMGARCCCFLVRFGLAERRVKAEGERERERLRVLVGGPRYSLLGVLPVVVVFCVEATLGGDLEKERMTPSRLVCVGCSAESPAVSYLVPRMHNMYVTA